jgi:transcriptional regulator with XRE-family HTH domain
MTVGKAIRERREELGLTRAELAAKMVEHYGGSYAAWETQIGRWEAGSREPSLSTLGRLAKAMGAKLVVRFEVEVAK